MKTRSTLIVAMACALLVGCNGGGGAPGLRGQSMVIRVRRGPWNGANTHGVSLRSRNYRIYTTSTNELLVRYLPGFMEAAHENYLRLTGLTYKALDGPMTIYLMGTRREWAALTRKVVRRNVETYLSIEAGGYCYDGICVFWDMGGLGTLSVASHEGLHQFFRRRMKDQIPMWLEEGLCVTAEGYDIFADIVTFTPDRNVGRFNNLRNNITQNRWIPIDRLLPMDAGMAIDGSSTERAVGYYGQLWAMVQFIRSRADYRAGMSRLIADAEAGRLNVALKVSAGELEQLRRYGRIYNRIVSVPLFERYITDDLEKFEKEYRLFARKLVNLQH